MIGKSFDFLSALTGALRCRMGLCLLELWFWRQRLLGTSPTFDAGWRVVMHLRWFFRGRAYHANTYRDNWRHFALQKLLRRLRKVGCPDKPAIVTQNEHLAEKSSGRLVLLAPHSRVNPALDAVAALLNLDLCGIGAYSGDMHELLDVAVDGPDIDVDATSLLNARRFLMQGKTIYVCPDYFQRRPGALYHDLYLSPATFEFAEMNRAELLFAYCGMNDQGEIVVTFGRPAAGARETHPKQTADAFLNFCKELAPQFQGMSIKRPANAGTVRKQYKNLSCQPASIRRILA